MDPKGYEKKPWFPYVKNMYDEIGADMMDTDAKGYEEKPWWPYVLDLQKKIEEGGGGGGGDLSTATLTFNNGFRLPSKSLITARIESGEGPQAGVYSGLVLVQSGMTKTIEVPLYKGLFVMDFDTSEPYELTGDARVENGKLYVTGNATINYVF